MKLDKTTISLASLAAIAAAVAVYSLRESSEPAMSAGSVGYPESAALETNRTSSGVPQSALAEQERTRFAELRQRHGMEELERSLNPQSSEERQQAGSGNTLTPFDHANFQYDWRWAEFVSGLGLSPEDAQLVRDVWIDSRARFIDLGIAMGEGTHEEGAAAQAQGEVETRLLSRLSQILSPEQMAAFHDHEEQIRTNVRASSRAIREELLDSGYSGLISAADNNDLPTVQAYLASGADPNRLTTEGKSALHEAAINNNPEMLRALIDAGADVNLTMLGRGSALRDAVIFGSTDAARVLVEAGADPNQRRDLDNPFSVALTSAAQEGHTEMVRILLDAGADATGIAGEDALESAIGFGDREMEQLLIDAGADASRVGDRL
ncbi:MAG: ankyrin repeat domain-containing protein [Gammaproteobacteria bacterium]|nr:ankyrin repeat domain-containing protein [Gammaproteobacteria bacterium]